MDEDRVGDLIGAGLEGLDEAARKFDPEKAKGRGFQWYAKFYITNRITDEMRRLDTGGLEIYLDDALPLEYEGQIPVVEVDED